MRFGDYLQGKQTKNTHFHFQFSCFYIICYKYQSVSLLRDALWLNEFNTFLVKQKYNISLQCDCQSVTLYYHLYHPHSQRIKLSHSFSRLLTTFQQNLGLVLPGRLMALNGEYWMRSCAVHIAGGNGDKGLFTLLNQCVCVRFPLETKRLKRSMPRGIHLYST